jgi:putative hemin transport protein
MEDPVSPTDAPAAEPTEAIRAWFRHDPSRMTMMAARRFGVPEQAVVEALIGQAPIVRLRDGAFRAVLDALPGLGTMRVFVRSKAAVIEAVGTFGGYSETGPFFNVQTETLDMHILPAELGALYAVQKPGHDSDIATYSFQFFDRGGDAAFKVFLWEDFPRVPAHRIAAFLSLVRHLAAAPGSEAEAEPQQAPAASR